MNASTGPSYLTLLKTNAGFRNLWYGQVVSELGDWLNSIAIYMLVMQLGGGGMAMALTMMAKLMPVFFVSPIAGVLIDRMDRRTILMASDLFRFVVVLCFLFVDAPGELWLLYSLVIVEIALAGFFEPARSAMIPSLTRREELVTANALSGSTWSVMVAVGAALGGVLVSWFGIQTAFIIDAFTFLVSAFFISRIPKSKPGAPLPAEAKKSFFKDLFDAGRYLKSEPGILILALLKSGLAMAGGIMTLIPLYAARIYSAPEMISMAIGIIYSGRGIGAALGPPLVRRLFGDSTQALRAAISVAFFLGAGAYLLFSRSESLVLATASIGLATFFGSIIWVFSSALIHLQAEDRFLGRIFSLEMALLTLVMGLSNFAVGGLIETMGWGLQTTAQTISIVFLLPGIAWGSYLLFLNRKFKKGECVGSLCPVEPSDAKMPPTSL